MKCGSTFRMFIAWCGAMSLLIFAADNLSGQNVTANSVEFINPALECVATFDITSNGIGAEMDLFYRLLDGVGALEFDSNLGGEFCIFRIHGNAGSNTLILNEGGVGIGTDETNSGLHVFSDGGVSSPFTDAKVIIENAELGAPQAREQLRLKNNGPTRFGMTNTDLGVTWSFVTTDDDQFQIRKNGPSTASMAIRANGTFAFSFGGVSNFRISPNGNATLLGTLNQGSDRNSKKNIHPVNPQEILAKVLDMPISNWTYKKDADTVRHLGPMSQDFHSAFGLGNSDKTISTLDSAGVALAAIQGLHSQVEAKDKKIADLSNQLKAQSQLVAELAERLEQLESIVSPANN